MGAAIEISENQIKINESQLKPIEIDAGPITDTFITLAILMSTIPNGRSRIYGIANQRVKECDRIHAVALNLTRIGIFCKEFDDGLEIIGKSYNDMTHEIIKIKTYNDHRLVIVYHYKLSRIAMSFTILAFYAKKIDLIIDNKDCVNKTFPDFYEHIKNTFGINYEGVNLNNRFNFITKYSSFRKSLFIIGMRGSGKTTLSKYVKL